MLALSLISKSKLLSLILLLLASTVEANSFFSYYVIDINNAEKINLSAEKDTAIVLFFEPDCSWCFKQSKVFNKHLKRCNPATQFIGIGVNGTRQELKKEAWKFKAQFPLYMASPDLLQAIGSIPATPLTLILNKQGEVLANIKGYLPFDKWQQTLRQYSKQTITCKS